MLIIETDMEPGDLLGSSWFDQRCNCIMHFGADMHAKPGRKLAKRIMCLLHLDTTLINLRYQSYPDIFNGLYAGGWDG